MEVALQSGMMDFVPRGNYLALASVSKAFRLAYLRAAGGEDHRAAYFTSMEGCVESISMLSWARESGCWWNWKTAKIIARGGHLDVLRWAREQGCEWGAQTCSAAASKGHMDVLELAREMGCPWDDATCNSAAQEGRLDILKWARANGCPWSQYTTYWAANKGHLKVLQWAVENGCPYFPNSCVIIAKHLGHREIVRWLTELRSSGPV
jgi:hypothetical protein